MAYRTIRAKIVTAILVSVHLLLAGSSEVVSQSLQIEDRSVSSIGETIPVKVLISGAPNSVTAPGFDLLFEAEVLSFAGFSTPADALVTAWPFFNVNSLEPGRLRIGGYTITESISSGANRTLTQLNFTVLQAAETTLRPEAAVDDIATWRLGEGRLTFASVGNGLRVST